MRWLICSLVLAGCTPAVKNDRPEPSPEPKTVTVPLKAADPLAIFEADIEGHGTVRLAVDPGNPNLKLDAKLGIETDTVTIRIGGAVLEDVGFDTADMRYYTTADGVLGVREMTRFNLTIDPGEQTLTLRPRGKPFESEGARVPIRVVDGHIFADGQLNDREITWWIHPAFDNGPVTATLDAYEEAGEGVSSARRAAERGERRRTFVFVEKASAGEYVQTGRLIGFAGTFPTEWQPPEGETVEGILSAPFFGGKRLTFDFDSGVLFVE